MRDLTFLLCLHYGYERLQSHYVYCKRRVATGISEGALGLSLVENIIYLLMYTMYDLIAKSHKWGQ